MAKEDRSFSSGIPDSARGAESEIALSPRAVNWIQDRLAAEKRDPSMFGLRVRLVAGGCPGFLYVVDLDSRHDDDSVFHSRGVQVLVDAASMTLLRGSTVDYESTAGEGFRIQNPNLVQQRPCGCGSSSFI